MACRGVPRSNSHSCTQLCSSVPSFLALCLSRFTLQLSHLSLSVTLCFFLFLYSALSLLHLCLIFTLCPSCPTLSFSRSFCYLSFLTYKHPASLSSVPLYLAQIHFRILQCFIYTLPPLLLSVGSLCWGRHPKEPACHKSYTLGREEVWQRTCALTRLIPSCFIVQSSRQREQPKVKHSRWM